MPLYWRTGIDISRRTRLIYSSQDVSALLRHLHCKRLFLSWKHARNNHPTFQLCGWNWWLQQRLKTKGSFCADVRRAISNKDPLTRTVTSLVITIISTCVMHCYSCSVMILSYAAEVSHISPHRRLQETLPDIDDKKLCSYRLPTFSSKTWITAFQRPNSSPTAAT